ncbi:MAG TPA: recombinase family protein [Xanthobacteraceae bacterium]|nr:recombinase family protein [Xanthobacteraceae bacterium]
MSSNTQNHDGQVEALEAVGCERVFAEKASGKSTNGRPALAAGREGTDRCGLARGGGDCVGGGTGSGHPHEPAVPLAA